MMHLCHTVTDAAGLAVAERLGAPYPFGHDKLAAQQVRLLAAAMEGQCMVLVCLGRLHCMPPHNWPSNICSCSQMTYIPPAPLLQFDTYLRLAHGPFARRSQQAAAALSPVANGTAGLKDE